MRTRDAMGDNDKAAKSSMRAWIGKAIEELGTEIPGMSVVAADTSESIQTAMFGRGFPERFYNVGIAEQNMIGVAAGLALYDGEPVFCGTYQVFLERAIDQIRNTIAYCGLNVKVLGAHAGLATGPDGGSHQAIEDIAIMRAIPNMTVIAPSDAQSAYQLAKQAAKARGPAYIRMVRPETQDIYDGSEEVKLGKANVLADGSDVSIVASGLMVSEALGAARLLKAKGIAARVIDCHSIKPMDGQAMLKAAKETGAMVTVEDHNVYGGMGGAIAEMLSEQHPTRMRILGVNDRFGESGSAAEVLGANGLDAASIARAAEKLISKA